MARAGRALAAITIAAAVLPAAARAGALEQVGHSALGNRGMNSALAIHGDYAYVGSRSDGGPPKGGVAVVDISDPRQPRLVHTIGAPGEGAAGLSSRELRVWPDAGLLMVLHFACEAPQTCLDYGAPADYSFYDIRGERAATPELIATYKPSRVPHEFFVWQDPRRPGRALLYMSTLTESGGDDLLVTDISRAREGVFDEVASWAAGIRNPDGSEVDLHSLSISTDGRRGYLAHLAAGFMMIDTSQLADARPRPEIRLLTPVAQRASWGAPGAHSALPLPGRAVALTTDEVYGATLGVAPALGVSVAIGCPWGWTRVLDVSDPARPRVHGEYKLRPYNEQTHCTEENRLQSEQATFSSHNPTVTRDLAFITWHSAGLQAVDLSDPARPVQVAEFRPQPLSAVATEDPTFSTGPDKLVFWSYPIVKDGLIYVVDIRNGLYVLRYSGRFAGQVSCAAFLEGNSNLGNAQTQCPLAIGARRARVARSGSVAVPVLCSTREKEGCSGSLRLLAGERRVGASRYRLAPGAARVRVRIAARWRQRLFKRGTLRVTATAITTVPDSDAERTTAPLTLYAPGRRMPRAATVRGAAQPRDRRLPAQSPPRAEQLARSGLVCLISRLPEGEGYDRASTLGSASRGDRIFGRA